MTVQDVFLIVVAIILAMGVWLFVPGWMIRRAIPKVIKIFRQKNAVGIQNAKTLQELGLAPKPMLERMMSRRDYKPKALDFLVQARVVQVTEDNKLYITEESVASAKWLKVKKDDSLRSRLSGG